MAMGDALAVCLMEAKGFTSADFAKFHPGGALGKKLYLRVSD
jgi:arabinose-5-phosphate isomerase